MIFVIDSYENVSVNNWFSHPTFEKKASYKKGKIVKLVS